MPSLRQIRLAVQLAAVAAATLLALNAAYLVALASQTERPGHVTSWLAAAGWFPFGAETGTLSIEDYCPFGPVEGVVRFVSSLATGEGVSFVGPVTLRNLGVLLAVLLLVLVTKKTFCSWLCPFGAIFEILGGLGRKIGFKRAPISDRADRVLRKLPVGVLLGTVVLTALDGTLLFKVVDPFYALYALGSDARPWAAYGVLVGLLVVALAVPAIWCGYLCPMGVCLSPFSRVGLIRVTRTGACTECGACTRNCTQRLPVHNVVKVTAGACTNCLDCMDACPTPGALELRLEAPK